MGIIKEIDEEPISNVNNNNYKLLRQSNRTTIKVVKGFLYLSLLGEGIKTYKGKSLLNTLVSTLGVSFIVGSLFYVNKLSSGEEMIQLSDLRNEKEQIIIKEEKDNEEKEGSENQDLLDNSDSDEYSSDEEEDEEDHVDCTNKKVGFSMLKLYKFIPYGVAGALAGNCIASITMGVVYGVSAPVEWNFVYYKEILFHINRLGIENFIFFFATDLFFKAKYLIYKENEKKTISNKLYK
ncbi:hypothetical protein RB653_004340 [Dictyostelium firmibasis]|uniref:Transmembrane protein n=1 Tax=Dictyostelium firmibasis TaxID=79012 RepID=A0AAN7YSA3_9MYCE